MNDYEIAVMRGQQNMSQEQRLAACRDLRQGIIRIDDFAAYARSMQNGWRPGIENEVRRADLVQFDADLRAAARVSVDWIFWGWVIGLFSLAGILLFLGL